MNKTLLIIIAVILFLVASFLVYKKFIKKDEIVASTPGGALPEPETTTKPADTVAVNTGIVPVVDRELLLTERQILTVKLSAENYKLFNMERYMKGLTDQAVWNNYNNSMYLPLKSVVASLQRQIDDINVKLA